MDRYAPVLIAAAAAILLLFGLMHLWYTLRSKALNPRDAALEARMREVAPVISRETTMWQAWVGFNVSHSASLICFGFFYLYLAIRHTLFLQGEPVLLVTGLLFLISYYFMARAYWFSVPRRGVVAAIVLYAAGLALDWF
jgi:hypothetical protein